jgi:hypothetical protein
MLQEDEPMTILTNTGDPRPNARVVKAEAHVVCPFSIAEEYAVDYLRRAEAGREEAEVRVPIRFFPTVLRRRAAVTFSLHFDIREPGRTHDEIHVRWSSRTRLLPNFRGTIRYRIDGSGTRLIVEGSYRVPFGTVGRLFDHLVGHYLARTSLCDFTRRIASFLETSNRHWLARVSAKQRSNIE